VPETTIHPSAVVSEEAIIGRRCIIGPNVHVGPAVTLGDDCLIQAGASIGSAGYGFDRGGEGTLYRKVHYAAVHIGNGVAIGANTVIDRGVSSDTIIGDGTKIDNLVHVGHQTTVGVDVLINQRCGLAGRVTIGDAVKLQPNVSVGNNVRVGDGTEVGMDSTVLSDLPPHVKALGTPARVIDEDWCWWG
jgi:UDP-3-O-[3-hydroxymyristoyl] glucosamine N-acyltransferase